MRMSADIILLQQIADDVADIKERIVRLETTMEELDMDFHEIRPEYLEKLKKIEKEGTVSQEAFEKEFGVKI